jgi:hypothetical protein
MSLASIRQQGNACEIRECRPTKRGPRQYTLARFKGVLTPEVLEEAAARAHRPFDAQKLLVRARSRGIAVSPHRTQSTAQQLLAELRTGRVIEPSLVALLKEALAVMEERPLPEHLAGAADWLGKSEAARGKALRGLLRTASRVVRSRGPRRALPDEPFPRFSSGELTS